MIDKNEQLTLDEHEEIFQKLACFTAPTAIDKTDLPNSILDNLVEHALYLRNKSLSYSEIAIYIRSQFNLVFESYEIKNSVTRLIKKGTIVNSGGNYLLEVNYFSYLQKIVKEKNDQENSIHSTLIQKIKIKYPFLTEDQLTHIGADFKKFLTTFFLLAGAEAVQLIYGNPDQVRELVNKMNRKNIFDLLEKRSANVRQIEQKEFCIFIDFLSEKEKVYLQDLLDRSLQYFTITVDKKCEALLTETFKDWTLFIDTNFIYNLIGLHGVLAKKSAEQLLYLGKKAGVSFFVTPITFEEFSYSVSKAREILVGNNIARELYKVASEFTGNTILAAYYDMNQRQQVSPRDFLVKIENIKEILNSYGISEKTEYSKSIRGDKEFADTVAKLIKLTRKEQHVAEHDAFIYLLVLKLRFREGAGSEFRTNKTWFLTHDSLLAPFEFSLKKNVIPFCIRPFQLRQILRPLFSRTDDFERVFIDFVSEPSSRAFPQVSADVAMKVLSRVTYYSNEFNIKDTPTLAISLLTNQHFINELHELRMKESEQVKFIDDEIRKVIPVENKDSIPIKEAIVAKINYWNYINPFWLFWSSLKFTFNLIKRYKIISVTIIIVGLLATDYRMAWRNAEGIFDFFKNLF